MTIKVAAMKWAPPFSAGMVRDMRVRWILNEVGWPYVVTLVDAPVMKPKAYREKQPFGRLPCSRRRAVRRCSRAPGSC
jgi:glutathione S-transferase